MKRACSKCKEEKSLDRYDKDSSRMLGHSYVCKDCSRISHLKSYYANHDKHLAVKKSYYNNNKKYFQVKTVDYRKRNPEKFLAGNLLRNAVRRGEIQRKPCEECGDTKSHGHHPDYSKPLEVKWLCVKHHMQIHRKVELTIK